ncbi:MAG: aminotransferase class V-fold PLP-dependent enzyme [Burkholderiales bacterium]
MTTRNVQLFAPHFDIDRCLEEVRACLEKGWTGIGFKTVEFEKRFCAYVGEPFGHFVNSNTNGMHLLLEMLKLKREWQAGDEVVSTAMTFVSTNHSILHADLKPVFADVDASLCVTAESVRAVLTPRTKAVVFISIGGNSGELEAIAALCKEKGLVLILDAAHACGSRLHGQHLSAYADYTVFSFQAVKNLPTGDSGLVTVRDAAEDELLRRLAWCGINKDTYSRSKDGYKWLYSVDEVGFKYHGNAIMAGMALVGLEGLDEGNARRRAIAARYREALDGYLGLTYIAHANEAETSRHLAQFFCPDRDKLINHLDSCNIGTGVHYRSNSRYPMYADQKTPNAETFDQQIISLPLHLRLTDDDVEYVIGHIKAYMNLTLPEHLQALQENVQGVIEQARDPVKAPVAATAATTTTAA